MLDSIGAIAPPRCHIGPAGPVTVNDGRRESDVTMDDHDRLAGRFEEHRSHLRAVAYRMLGSLTEADDAVQEAWLHLGRSGAAGVENLGGWLTTVVARVCLDKLRARRSRPEELAGVRLPDPIVDHRDGIDPEHQALLADAVGLALLVVLDTLRPAERVAFVLHDLFALPFTEIAPLLGRSVAATRQLASRARRRVRGAVPAPDADLGRQRAVVGAFLAASRDGDFDALMAVLDPEVVLRAEQAGTSTEVRGARAVASAALGFAWLARHARLALVNGAAGLVAAPRGRPASVLGFTVAGGRIAEIDILADPGRLGQLDLAALDG
jgi:RNA polymerase sigma factor (sigma-70 family)